MKAHVTVTVAVLLACLALTDGLLFSGCTHTCRDQYPLICPRIGCGSLIAKAICQVTCKVCKWCPNPNPPCLFNGTCFDANPVICTEVKSRNLCHAGEKMCSKTCGYCHDCDVLPEDPNACDPTCKDANPTCPEWKEHCAPTSIYKAVPHICPATCETCKACKLPPTKTAAASEDPTAKAAKNLRASDVEMSILPLGSPVVRSVEDYREGV